MKMLRDQHHYQKGMVFANPGLSALIKNPTVAMKRTIKGLYLVLSTAILTLLHLPFAFAKNGGVSRTSDNRSASGIGHFRSPSSFAGLYDSLQLNMTGLSRRAFDYAVTGYERLVQQGKLVNQSILAIVDFSQSSTQKRLYILDIQNYRVLFNTLVAHGRNSGKEFATHFSNSLSSYQSSPGFYITGDAYIGSNGYSLRLEGLERGINDRAMQRAIVLHGADYVNESLIASQGYIGRSQGCPAVPVRDARNIINTIRNGACLYIYAPDQHYLSHSSLLGPAAES